MNHDCCTCDGKLDEEVEFYAEKAHEYLKKEPAWEGHFSSKSTGDYASLEEGAKERRRAIARFAILAKKFGPLLSEKK